MLQYEYRPLSDVSQFPFGFSQSLKTLIMDTWQRSRSEQLRKVTLVKEELSILTLSSRYVDRFLLSLEFCLVHQISDLLVHLAKEVHIAMSHWVNTFVFHQEMFEPSFELVALSYDG